MIYIQNNTRLVNYNDLFELTRLFFPEEEIVDNSTEPFDKTINLRLIGNNFLVELTEKSGKPGSFVASPSMVEIYRDLASSQRVAAKRALYSLLNEYTGINLPWGILTGIRPVKVAAYLFEKGIPERKIIDILTDEYFIDFEKAELALQVCRTQENILKSFKRDTYSIYISIPFCPSRCLYCSFPSLPAAVYESQMGDYLKVLMYELGEIDSIMKNWKLTTVYIGGGTPTALPKNLMRQLLEKIRELFPQIIEFTVEAGRPDTIDIEYLQIFKDFGVDRISINPQTMRNETLRNIGRKHTAEEVIETYKAAKKIGISVVNMDLIVGLPGEITEDVEYTLEMIDELNPDNLTVHTLSVKKGSHLISSEGSIRLTEAKTVEDMLKLTSKYALNKGMVPYYLYRQKHILGNLENVGYSNPENPCIYNIAIMEEKQTIIAVGMGAITKLYDKKNKKLERIPNFKDLNSYMVRIEELLARKRVKIKDIEDGWR